MLRNKTVKDILVGMTDNRDVGKLTIDNKTLIESLVTDKQEQRIKWYASKRLHFVLLLSTIVLFTASVIYYTISFINDVILFKIEMRVNEQGALNPQKALSCEYALYLFNASEPWANTGVRINKGDKYKINISGGTNTAITEIIESARNNTKPNFSWVSYHRDYICDPEPLLKLCLSKGDVVGNGKNKALVNFGSMLYTIQPEGANVVYSPQEVNANDIHKWVPVKNRRGYYEAKGFEKASSSGFLYLAVNDLVFSKRAGENSNLQEQFDAYNKEAKISGKFDTLSKPEMDMLQDYISYYFKDNLGQILVSIEIVRNVSCFSLNYPLYAYRDYEYATQDTGLFLNVIYFLLFVIKILGFYAICMGSVWLLICLPFFLFYVIKKPKQATS